MSADEQALLEAANNGDEAAAEQLLKQFGAKKKDAGKSRKRSHPIYKLYGTILQAQEDQQMQEESLIESYQDLSQ